MPNEQKAFQQIIDVSLEFAQAKDVDFLLEKILNAAKILSNADAGSIYLEDEEETIRLHHTQNSTMQHHLMPGEKLLYPSALPAIQPDSTTAYAAKTGEIISIPDVHSLPEDAPYSFYSPQGEGTHYQAKTLLAFPLKNSKRHSIGVIELINPHNDAGELMVPTDDVLPLIRLFANNATNAIERALAARSRIMGILHVLTTLRNTEETLAHFNRVGAYAAEIYETWAINKGLPQTAIEAQKNELRTAAMLHDIGKLAIPNIIRGKPGKLTPEEYETMKQHTVKGAQLLLKYAQSDLEKIAAEIALTHHERWNGSGYPGHVNPETAESIVTNTAREGKPRGKRGEEIPVFGRVVAIADFYDALRSPRIYREAWKEKDVLAHLKKGAGILFDPEMVEAFFQSLDTIRAIAKRYPDEA